MTTRRRAFSSSSIGANSFSSFTHGLAGSLGGRWIISKLRLFGLRFGGGGRRRGIGGRAGRQDLGWFDGDGLRFGAQHAQDGYRAGPQRVFVANVKQAVLSLGVRRVEQSLPLGAAVEFGQNKGDVELLVAVKENQQSIAVHWLAALVDVHVLA